MTLILKAERWHFVALDKHTENHEEGRDLKGFEGEAFQSKSSAFSDLSYLTVLRV